MKTMKTSNIIISAFAIFLIGGMLTLFIDAKHYKKTFDESIVSREIALPQFSVVVAEKGANFIDLQQSDSTQLTFKYFKSQKMPSKLYKVSNDTLYLYCHNNTLQMVIKCKNIKSIISYEATNLNFYKFTPDTMTLNMTGGNVHFNNENLKGMKLIEKSIVLNITATKYSFIEFKNVNINKINLNSNKSLTNIITNFSMDYFKKNHISNETQFCMNRKTKFIIATLKNNSTLRISENPLKLNVDCDSTSGFQIGNVF